MSTTMLSSVSMLSNLNIGGSTLDLNTIVSQLDALNRIPGDQLNTQISALQSAQSQWNTINGQILSLQQSLDTLTSSSTFGNFTATSSDNTSVTAVGSTSASAGTYQITVQNLAQQAADSTGYARLGSSATVSTLINDQMWGGNLTAGSMTVNYYDSSGNKTTSTITINATDSIQTVLNNIQAINSNITATFNPATATSNATISISVAGGGSVSFGSPADSSNFASFTGLDAAGKSANITGKQLGAALLGNPMNNANLAHGNPSSLPTADANGNPLGTFTINGKTVTYNAATDTLSTIISKINGSGAGVTAAYNPLTDKLTVTSATSQPINIYDGTSQGDTTHGNLMQVLGLDAADASVTAGSTAQFTINGVSQTATSNTVTTAIPGVTLNLLKQQSSPVTITVSPDNTQVTANIQAFITQFNTLYSNISNQMDPTQKGPLVGDTQVQNLQSQLMNIVGSAQKTTVSYSDSSVMALGISTGAIGSKPGTTNSLVLDTNKLNAALQQNPQMVKDILTAMATNLNTTLSSYTGYDAPATASVTDVFIDQSQQNMYSSMISDLQNQQQTIYDAADQQKQMLISEFTAMNAALAQSKTQGNALLGFLPTGYQA